MSQNFPKPLTKYFKWVSTLVPQNGRVSLHASAGLQVEFKLRARQKLPAAESSCESLAWRIFVFTQHKLNQTANPPNPSLNTYTTSVFGPSTLRDQGQAKLRSLLSPPCAKCPQLSIGGGARYVFRELAAHDSREERRH